MFHYSDAFGTERASKIQLNFFGRSSAMGRDIGISLADELQHHRAPSCYFLEKLLVMLGSLAMTTWRADKQHLE